MPSAHPLMDHDEIRKWAEARHAQPACVRRTGGKGDPGMIRLDFPGFSGAQSLSPISWDQWFRSFDENNLALLVQDRTARGQQSNFNKLVSRESITEGLPPRRRRKQAARAGAGRRRTTGSTAKRTSSAGGSRPASARSSSKRSSTSRSASGRSSGRSSSAGSARGSRAKSTRRTSSRQSTHGHGHHVAADRRTSGRGRKR